MTTLVDEVMDLESRLQSKIPCLNCDRPATLRSFGHGPCPEGDGRMPPFYKCDQCFVKWYSRVGKTLARCGTLRHATCGLTFRSVEDFSDYREF